MVDRRRRRRRPCADDVAITCMIAPRSRTEPALPTTSRGPPSPTTIVGAIMLVSRRPELGGRAGDEVVLAEHVVELDARCPGRSRRSPSRSTTRATRRCPRRRPRRRASCRRRACARRVPAATPRSARTAAASDSSDEQLLREPAAMQRRRERLGACARLLAHHLGQRRERLGGSRLAAPGRARAARARTRSGCRPTTAAGSRSPRARDTGRGPARARSTSVRREVVRRSASRRPRRPSSAISRARSPR